MPVAARKMEIEEFPGIVIQYWLCLPVEAQVCDHVYFLGDGWYKVTGYLSAKDAAIRICRLGKLVAEIQVHNYSLANLHAHKKEFTFIRWAYDNLPKPEAPE